VLGYTNNSLSVAQRAESLEVVAGHAAAGRLTVSHEIVPFADVPDAWERQVAGIGNGRIVLSLGR
jgi:hypothetical protein